MNSTKVNDGGGYGGGNAGGGVGGGARSVTGGNGGAGTMTGIIAAGGGRSYGNAGGYGSAAVGSSFPPVERPVQKKGILAAAIIDNHLTLDGANGGKFIFWDNGQRGTERRYMTTDGDLQSLVGRERFTVEPIDGPDIQSRSGTRHETYILKVSAGDCLITVVCHNEHNGDCRGFNMKLDLVPAP